MIELGKITEETAKLLYKKTGIFSACDRVNTQTYPTFVVSAVEKAIVITGGGEQVERTIALTIKCFASRANQSVASGKMVDGALGCVMPYLAICTRHFTPTDVECIVTADGVQIDCNITFCDVLGVREPAPDNMGSIKLEIEGGK